MGVRETVRRYRGLPPSRRRLLREALAALLWSRLGMALLPFRRLARRLGEAAGDPPEPLDAAALREIGEIAWAVQAAAGRVPWDSRCLAQALAAGRMLRRRGLDSVLFLGVRRDPSSGFAAHAWLRCGPLIVTGGDGSREYDELGRFAPGGPRP